MTDNIIQLSLLSILFIISPEEMLLKKIFQKLINM